MPKDVDVPPLLDVLDHSLVLLLAGAVISGGLLPRLSRGWQDRQKALDVKTSLVERVTRAVMDITTAVQFVTVGAASESQEDFDKAYGTWQMEKWVLTALIGAYYRSATTLDAWVRLRALATAHYVQVGVRRRDAEETEAARERYLRSVAAGLDTSPPRDLSDDPRSFETSSSGREGEAIVNPVVLREEVQRALSVCVGAIVDEPLSLTSRSRQFARSRARSPHPR